MGGGGGRRRESEVSQRHDAANLTDEEESEQ